MSTPRAGAADTPPRRVFGFEEPSPADDDAFTASPGSQSRTGRISFLQGRRPSFAARWRGQSDEENTAAGTSDERPPIPSALHQSGEAYTTPLPTLSMIVLSITLLGEFLTANVSTPFLLFMVEGFGEFTEEADVGFWTGVLVATFFLTQFLTSLLWATVADRHGQRLVLFISLLGGSLTCALFGTSKSLKQAVVIRLMQGVFAGAIGVARGCVTVITDPSNEGRAYAILGFCWGFGGVAGAIVGGTFETPAKKWPGVFNSIPLFVDYPYLLPTIIAASVTFLGSILSLFLGPDGGPREGAIRLPPEKSTPDAVHPTIPEEESAPPSPTSPTSPRGFYGGLHRVSRKLSVYFASRVPEPQAPSVPLSTSVPARRTFSRTSRANGSAYGYGGGAQSFRNRLSSNASGRTHSYRRGSTTSTLMRRRGSSATAANDGGADSERNFAQRLLMANENAVTNIADLWVAAAMNVDNEEVFESETEEEGGAEGVFETEGEEDDLGIDLVGVEDTPTRKGKGTASMLLPAHRMSLGSQRPRPSFASSARPPSTSHGLLSPNANVSSPPRRFSNAVPGIFSHSGVRTPPAVLDAQKLLDGELLGADAMPLGDATEEDVAEKPPSLMSQLPFLIITQYGLLALHSTTHDMVFLSYLVSKYESGGLNLNAGHFSQLTALMCLAQIAYQFYLYPNIGPPRGRFSHLSMFRLGSLLFIPAYLTVTMYRVFASAEDDGNFMLMAVLTVSTAVRYAGNTFAYTSVSILLNYMSPPPVVGLANGIAQSIVSLARCFGPILGGYLWSVSVDGHPSGYYIGFFVCAGACALAMAHSSLIR
ncbi:major facilitator superfamily MFS-1 [Artomyces pyxidatus]|uniref:Major facilitator superfamily MFS-1 n=1 Tax=Artomyces pyxidatus TaxID=48021 RepID=A0ACB8SJ13_9AGAM|nr:major facilitator superfamily MFS-1 [Artomyces pyxidatus]